MTKVQKASTGSLNRLTKGAGIFVEDVQEVVECMNWSAANRPNLHFSMLAGPSGSSIEGGVGSSWGFIASGVNTMFDTDIYIAPDAISGTFGAWVNAHATASNQALTTITITGEVGSTYLTIAHASGTSTVGREVTTTFDWGPVGRGGFARCEIEGSASQHDRYYINAIRLEDTVIATQDEMRDPYPVSVVLTPGAPAPTSSIDLSHSFVGDGVNNIISSSLTFNEILKGVYGAVSGTSTMSISAWFYVSGSDALPTTWPSTGVLFGVRNSGGGASVRQNSVSMAARAGVPTQANFSWCSSPTNIINDGLLNPASTVNTWHHMLWVFSGSGATSAERNKLWIDGTAMSLTFVSPPPLSIASSSNNICWASQQAGANRSPIAFHNFGMYTAALTGTHASEQYFSSGTSDLRTLSGAETLFLYIPGTGSATGGFLSGTITPTSGTTTCQIRAVSLADTDITSSVPPTGVITW